MVRWIADTACVDTDADLVPVSVSFAWLVLTFVWNPP